MMSIMKCSSHFPLISIVVPCFNSYDYIHNTIRSLQKQTYNNVEIIIIDDQSSDETFQLLKEISKSDHRIIARLNPKKGANSARELGVRLANGEFIMFMDADDQWKSNSVETLIDYALRLKVDAVCCNIEKRLEQTSYNLFHFAKVDQAINLEAEPRYLTDIPPSACGKLFNAEILKSFSFLDVPFSQDWNITYKFMARAKSIAFINDPLYYYIVRKQSTSTHSDYEDSSILTNAEQSIIDINDFYHANGKQELFDLQLKVLNIRFYLNLLIRSYRIIDANEQYKFYLYLRRKISNTSIIKLRIFIRLPRNEKKKYLALSCCVLSYYLYIRLSKIKFN